MSTSTIPIIQARTLLGFKTGVRGTATYISDNEVLYPAAGVLTLHNFTQRRQQFIRLNDKENINILCLTPNRKYAAVADVGDKPTISGYDLKSLKRKKTLTIPLETTAREFVSLDFTHDGKYLIAVLGEPDWLLLCYNWEKCKLESYGQASIPNNAESTIKQVACNPTDSSVVCLVGPGTFRLMSCADNSWHQFGFQYAENYLLTCATWITFDKVLAGTSDDMILLVEGAELKNIFKATEVMSLNIKLKDESLAQMNTESESCINMTAELLAAQEYENEVRELITFARGFAYVCGSGMVHLFEKETNSQFKKRNVFTIVGNDFREKPTNDLNRIQHLCINLNEDTLMATTDRNQMYSVELWGPDMVHSPEIEFKILGEPLHYGAVRCVAMCPWKTLFITAGEVDRTVRVWNYNTMKMEMMKQYGEDVHCLSLHPTGLYLLIGFSDLLRFTILLIDDIQVVREFPIRNCALCVFSGSGHLFAAVNGNIIQVYSTISFENLYNLKGHEGRVTTLRWTDADARLVTCGSEGVLYEWEVQSEKRVGEVVSLDIPYIDCVVTNDGSTWYSVGSDGKISMIQETNVLRTYDVIDGVMDALVLSRSNLMMFVAAPSGALVSVKFPLTTPPEYNEYCIHSKKITGLCMSYNDENIITTSKDGTICMWRLTFHDGKTAKMDKHFRYSKEVLVSKKDLEENLRMISILTSRIVELETEHAYQIRQIDVQHQDTMKEVHAHYCMALEELKSRNERVELDHSQEMTLINSDIYHMKEAHSQVIETMETNFNARLIIEYDKYSGLELKMQRLRKEYERDLEMLVATKDAEKQDVQDTLTAHLKEKTLQCEELTEESKHKQAEHEEIKRQIEDDVDEEILELKSSYEKLLQEERDTTARLNGEIVVYKKKFIGAQRETNEYCRQMHEMQKELVKSQSIILSLERDCSELKKEIKERDGTLADKEKRIYDLKQRNQESEKFKVVLEHKIKELKSLMEPKDRELMEQKEQIKDMSEELRIQQKGNTTLNLQVLELRRKLNIVEKEYVLEHKKCNAGEALMQHVRMDLHDASGHIQEPKKLRDLVRKMFHTYSEGQQLSNNTEEVEDAQQEFLRQRHHLEKTVATLKHKINKKAVVTDNKAKLLEENVSLVEEVNKLRRELKVSQRRVRDMEAILGVGGTAYMRPWVAQKRLRLAVKSKQEMEDECEKKIDQSVRNTKMLKEEVQRLVRKLPRTEQVAHEKEERDMKKMEKIMEMKAELDNLRKKKKITEV